MSQLQRVACSLKHSKLLPPRGGPLEPVSLPSLLPVLSLFRMKCLSSGASCSQEESWALWPPSQAREQPLDLVSTGCWGLISAAWNPSPYLSHFISVILGKCIPGNFSFLHFAFTFYFCIHALWHFPLEYGPQPEPVLLTPPLSQLFPNLLPVPYPPQAQQP